jgi:phosphopantothenate synthetase
MSCSEYEHLEEIYRTNQRILDDCLRVFTSLIKGKSKLSKVDEERLTSIAQELLEANKRIVQLMKRSK